MGSSPLEGLIGETHVFRTKSSKHRRHRFNLIRRKDLSRQLTFARGNPGYEDEVADPTRKCRCDGGKNRSSDGMAHQDNVSFGGRFDVRHHRSRREGNGQTGHVSSLAATSGEIYGESWLIERGLRLLPDGGGVTGSMNEDNRDIRP